MSGSPARVSGVPAYWSAGPANVVEGVGLKVPSTMNGHLAGRMQSVWANGQAGRTCRRVERPTAVHHSVRASCARLSGGSPDRTGRWPVPSPDQLPCELRSAAPAGRRFQLVGGFPIRAPDGLARRIFFSYPLPTALLCGAGWMLVLPPAAWLRLTVLKAGRAGFGGAEIRLTRAG